MKSTITLVVCLLSVAMFATNQAQAQTTANGPYYAWPAWDQKLQCDTLATCPRFIVLSNWNREAVLDRETGLVWEQSPSTTLQTWQNAQNSCSNKNVGNRKGWRLPTIQELASLIDPTVLVDPAAPPVPAIPAGHPFSNVVADGYWSATTHAVDASFARSVFFGTGGGSVGNSNKSSTDLVWCVRGGQGVDPQ